MKSNRKKPIITGLEDEGCCSTDQRIYRFGLSMPLFKSSKENEMASVPIKQE